MWERIINFALYGDTDRESFNAVKIRIEENNSRMAFVFASVATLLIGIMLMLSYVQEGFMGSGLVYLFGMILSVVQINISLIARKFPKLSYVSVYMAISVFLLYGIALATLTRPDQQTVTFMVMLIFVPLIFVERPISVAGVLTFYILLFLVMASRTKAGALLAVGRTDAVIFGILAIVSESVVNRAKIRGYVLEHKLHVMSETDQLTGLNNRNCYEMRLREYRSRYRGSICCVYMDINGLHELNNTEGHKAGDEMLCYIAKAVKEEFGQKDTYRVGGDEYVSFALDLPEKEVTEKILEMKEKIEKQGYHTAIGYEYLEGKDMTIDKLIVAAEAKMFRDKAEYYRARDRRGR